MRTNLKKLKASEVSSYMELRGFPDYRVRQLLHWIYGRRALSIDDITVFSKAMRTDLADEVYISNLVLIDRRVSVDGTEKYLLGLEDGETIESVLIPDRDRLTLCISTQAGCAMGCRFCRTGRGGLRRNLLAHEIMDQIICVDRIISSRRITNVVLMGMGEPLHNLGEVSEALWRVVDLLQISKRRITLSTSGLVSELLRFSHMAPDVNLAISLNATTDESRDRIMPVNRRYPLNSLLKACRKYPLGKRRRITFEYVLLDGINDFRGDAVRIVQLLQGIPSKVNLIPFNEFEGSGFNTPAEDRVLRFQEVLVKAGLTALIRKSKGQDILASCGQLRGEAAAEAD